MINNKREIEIKNYKDDVDERDLIYFNKMLSQLMELNAEYYDTPKINFIKRRALKIACDKISSLCAINMRSLNRMTTQNKE